MTNEPSWLALALAGALLLGLIGLIVMLVLTEAGAVTGLAGEATREPAPGEAAPGTPRTDDSHRHESRPAETSSSQRPGRAPRSAFAGAQETPQQRAAVIINPTKFTDLDEVKTSLAEVCREHGWAEPWWLETTAEDPGTGQTEQALAGGVDLVCALGGDGTVRTVGTALTGTGVPMGLLSAGTGNLLARNLRLPVDSPAKALQVALSGRNARIDTCVLRLTRPTERQLLQRYEDDDPADNVDLTDAADHPGGPSDTTDQPEEHLFLVMAGLGFDAEVMAGVPEALKAKVGWVAYLVSGARHLKGPQFVVDVRLDDGTRFHRRARSVIIGNVGRLQGGVVLMPDAVSDDGVVDMVLIAPRGVVGWAAVAAQVLTRQRRGHRRVEHISTTTVRIEASKPVEIQLDGDTLGAAKVMEVRVDPASLVVRMPA